MVSTRRFLRYATLEIPPVIQRHTKQKRGSIKTSLLLDSSFSYQSPNANGSIDMG